jgi:addiction module HigA family antidote
MAATPCLRGAASYPRWSSMRLRPFCSVAAAKGLGITRQQLHNLISGRSGITPEMAVKLEKAIGSTADTWLRMQMNYDLAQVRKRTINVKRLVPA